MRRFQLFEFNDQPWLPEIFQRLETDYLKAALEIGRPFSPKLPLIAQAMGQRSQIVDLCSGSGGPWGHLIDDLAEVMGEGGRGAALQVTLTDLRPVSAADFPEHPRLRYHPTPVDATDVPAALPGMRTIFDGFHHLPPDAARGVLAAAVRDGAPIAIFEGLERTLPSAIGIALLAPILAPIFTLAKVRPLTWWRVLFTFFIPVASPLIGWDGLVSTLRCYTPDELRAMAAAADPEGRWTWEAGTYRENTMPVTYLVGYPTA